MSWLNVISRSLSAKLNVVKSFNSDLIGTIELFKKRIYTSPTGQEYMTRYIIIGCKLFCVYIHKFTGDDWARSPHSHPRRFISFILKGKYTEVNYPSPFDHTKVHWEYYQAGDVNCIGLKVVHRIVHVKVPTWTLCIGGRVVQKWGFYDASYGGFVQFVPSHQWIAEKYKEKGK